MNQNNFIGIIIIFLLCFLFSCSGKSLDERFKEAREQIKKDSTIKHKNSMPDSTIDTTIVVPIFNVDVEEYTADGTDTVTQSRKADKSAKRKVRTVIKYFPSVKTTIYSLVNNTFPKLSDRSQEELSMKLLDNGEIVAFIDEDIEKVLFAKLNKAIESLDKLDISYKLDLGAPEEHHLNLSHRYKYIETSSGGDSIVKRKLKWMK